MAPLKGTTGKGPSLTSTIRLGRIRGIEIGIHWSLLLIGGLLVVHPSPTSVLPDLEPDAGGSYWAAAILATALFFASILAHELAHSFVAQRRGQRVEGITLWLLGGVARLKDEANDAAASSSSRSPDPRRASASASPSSGSRSDSTPSLADGSLLPGIAFYVGIVNLVLGVFNLLPGAPLDGGRILAAIDLGDTQGSAPRADRRGARRASSSAVLLIGGGRDRHAHRTRVRRPVDGAHRLVRDRRVTLRRARRADSRALDDHTVGALMGPEPPARTRMDDRRPTCA